MEEEDEVKEEEEDKEEAVNGDTDYADMDF